MAQSGQRHPLLSGMTRISPSNTGPVVAPGNSDFRFPKSWRSAVKEVERGLNNHESCYKRIVRLRKQTDDTRHRLDTLLICPTIKPGGFVRFLCYAAKWTEEMGEICADISSIVERLVRKTLSNGRNSDLAAVIGSGAGRLVTGKMNVMGISVNKAAGAAFYLLSTVLSLSALALVNKQAIGAALAVAGEPIKQSSQPDKGLGWSAQHRASRCLENRKEKCVEWARHSDFTLLRRLARGLEWQISRSKSSEADALPAIERRTHCDYMWNNLHQYGRLTRGLMITGHTLFQVTNRLFLSWDKYTARLLNQGVLKKRMGELLGHRLSSCLLYAASTALSIPTSHLVVGLSTIGAAICGITVVCFLLAKCTVLLGDWKGNMRPFNKGQRGNETRTLSLL